MCIRDAGNGAAHPLPGRRRPRAAAAAHHGRAQPVGPRRHPRRAAEGRSTRVTLELAVNEELTVPSTGGKAYSLETSNEYGGGTKSTYEAIAGRTVTVSRSSKGPIRVTMKVEGGPGHQPFTVVAELRFVEKKPAPRRKQP